MAKKMTPEKVDVIKREMAGLSGKAARQQAVRLAEQFGVSPDRVYHYSRTVRAARKERQDKGQVKAIPEQHVETLLWYTIKADFAAPHVADIARANGLGELSPSTYNRMLRQRNLSRRKNKKDLQPYQSWGADYPNQLHQIDTTLAEQFYIEDDGSVGIESRQERYKNKPGNRKPRLTLFGLVDDFSRVRYARFIAGNHTYAWMTALYDAWRQKDDAAGFPFQGLPRFLYTDNDSVVKSEKFQFAMKELGVQIITHKVGLSRAKGKVENSFKTLQEFQKVTLVKRWESIDAANNDLFDFLYKVNNIRHSTTGEIPFARWLAVPAERLRAVPDEEIFRLLHLDSTRCHLYKDLCIKLNGTKYQLEFKEEFMRHVGEYIDVFWYPDRPEIIYAVIDNKSYEIAHRDKIYRGVGKQEEVPQPAFLQKKADIEAAPDPGLKLTGIYKEMYRRPYLGKEAQAFAGQIAQKLDPKGPARNRAWFTLRLQKLDLVPTPVDATAKEFIAAVFTERSDVPEAELLDIIDQLQKGALSIYAKTEIKTA